MQKAYISSVPEKLDIKDKPTKQKEYVAEKLSLAENIVNFDKRVEKYYQTNPYSYNSISLKKNTVDKTPMEITASPIYGSAAPILGITDAHDWRKNSDKVQFIVDWAKQKTKIEDTQKLMSWIYTQITKVPEVSGRKLDDLYIYAKMGGKSFVPTKVVKIVEKIVKVKPKEYKVDTRHLVDNWMKEVLHV